MKILDRNVTNVLFHVLENKYVQFSTKIYHRISSGLRTIKSGKYVAERLHPILHFRSRMVPSEEEIFEAASSSYREIITRGAAAVGCQTMRHQTRSTTGCAVSDNRLASAPHRTQSHELRRELDGRIPVGS